MNHGTRQGQSWGWGDRTRTLDRAGPLAVGLILLVIVVAGLSAPVASACPYDPHVVLQHRTIAGAETFQACQTLTAGAGVTVSATGAATFQAGQRVALQPGFRVQAGGRLQVRVGESLLLTVTKTGTGSGTVTSNPAGINCGSACAADFAAGTVVTLTARPASGSTFSGWGGDCGGAICQLTMNQNGSVTATFAVSTTNQAPQVDAGAAQTIDFPATITLNGVVTDDGLPYPPGTITVAWNQVSGPEEVTFGNAAAASTTATFLRAGTYGLRLTANDGELMGAGDVTITVEWDEGLSSEVLEYLDTIPNSSVPDDQILFPDGQSLASYAAERGITLDAIIEADRADIARSATLLHANPLSTSDPQQRKKDIITKMLLLARYYACGRDSSPCTSWDYPADASDPTNKPAQTGMTYVYGGKNPYVRTLPVDDCPQMTYGIDCSGLVHRIAKAAGITLPVGTSAGQQKPENWNIPEEWRLKMKLVTDGTIETGDIIGWSGHIGIVESEGPPVRVISSTGGPGQCAANIVPKRGPRSLTLQNMSLATNWGNPTAILRLQGCEGQIIQVNDVDRYRVVGSDCTIVADLVTGLEWQRCSVGQSWNASTQSCDGFGDRFTWDRALTLTAPGGFRLPTLTELRSLVYCSNTGAIGMYEGWPVYCGGTYDGSWNINFQQPTIVQEAFPGARRSDFWSASPHADYSNAAWDVYFHYGYAYYSLRSNSGHVRLVRGGQ